MSQLTVVSSAPAMGYLPPVQAAHDLRNLLATVALHLETLQRLSGPSDARTSDAAHAFKHPALRAVPASTEPGFLGRWAMTL